MRWKNAALLALAVLAVGCSSNSKKELPPAELTKFDAEVELRTEWSRSVGDGQGDTFNMLVPAIDGEVIYAADVEGLVMAMGSAPAARSSGARSLKSRCPAPSVSATARYCWVPSRVK